MIDGHWEGFYEMEGMPGYECNDWGMQKFRVEAWLEVSGETVTGRMIDLDSEFEMLYADYFEQFKSCYTWLDARNAESFIKDYPQALMIVNGSCDSLLEGSLRDMEIQITKRYLGKHQTVYRYDNTETSHLSESGLIYYYGCVENTGLSIKGTYKTMGNRDFLPSTGYFELHKNLSS